jgi:hypothetical protein
MSEDSMLKSEILQVLKKQIGGAHKPLHVKLDEPIYEDTDRLNVNPTYSSIDDMETTDEGMFPNLYKNRVNFLNKQKQSKTRVAYPNSYMPKIFFGLGGAKQNNNIPFYSQSDKKLEEYQNETFGYGTKNFKLNNEIFKQIKTPKINKNDKAMNFLALGKPTQGWNKMFKDGCRKDGAFMLNLFEVLELQYSKVQNSFKTNYNDKMVELDNGYYITKSTAHYIETLKALNEWGKIWQKNNNIKDGLNLITTPYFRSVRKSADKKLKKDGVLFDVGNLKLVNDPQAIPQEIKNLRHDCKDKYIKQLNQGQREILNVLKSKNPKYKQIPAYKGLTDKEIVEKILVASQPKKSKKSKKAPKKQPTHVMPDGAIHTGKTHTKDSKVVKPAPKAKKAKKPPSAYNLFVKEFAKQNPNIGKNLIKEASKAYKASKDSGEMLPPPPDEFFDKKYISKLKRLEKQKNSKKPCKPPQTRNPDTGRCKNMGPKAKKEPKPCKPPQVRNPATGRCKKPKKEIKKRQLTAWDLHLKKVRSENPSVKGKQIMMLAKQSYNKPSSARPSIKIVDFQKPKLNEIEDPFLPNPKNNNNDDLMDEILDNFKFFIDQMELIANNNMSKLEKQDLFNNIISKVGLYAFQVNEEYGNQLSIAEREEIKKAYEYVEQTFDDTFGMLQDGQPDLYLSLEDFGEGDDIDKIILDSLEGENEPLYNQPIGYNDLVKYDEPPPLFRVPERTDASDYVYFPVDYESDDEYDDEYDYQSEEDIIGDTYIYDDLPIVSKSDIKDLGKGKKKLPLGLRVYQEYLRQYKIQFPEATRKELDELWKSNKDYYTDLIMDMTDLSGGDLLNEDHLFNVFRNMGGAMLSYNKMLGGAVTLKKDGTYGNTMYKATHPNVGPMVSNMKYQQPEAPSKKAPSMRKNPLSRSEPVREKIPFITPFLGYKTPDHERRLDNAQDWLDTFEDIGKGTFTGLKNVFSLLSPLSWF